MPAETLRNARKNKADEFYTQLSDIESEMKHYKDQLEGKVIFCNCDDPYESNFFKYFAMNFNFLKIKKLIATCYDSSPIAQTQLSFLGNEKTILNENRHAYKIEITEVGDYNCDGAVDLSDIKWLLKNKKNALSILKGNGDFRSEECVELLKEADIVVTNPPFSLFREYVAQLMEYKKKFLIIGNQNAITYKEIFHYIKENRIWLGYKYGDMKFTVPDYYQERTTRFWIDESGQKWRSMGNICWFTNLDTIKRHEKLTLYKKYSPDDYPKYDYYDAIEVSKTSDIPYDYDGIMGVPITFLDKYNPEQFEILGLDDHRIPWRGRGPNLNGKTLFRRIIIQRRKS